MPYCLILVLAPLSVFLNEENDIVPGPPVASISKVGSGENNEKSFVDRTATDADLDAQSSVKHPSNNYTEKGSDEVGNPLEGKEEGVMTSSHYVVTSGHAISEASEAGSTITAGGDLMSIFSAPANQPSGESSAAADNTCKVEVDVAPFECNERDMSAQQNIEGTVHSTLSKGGEGDRIAAFHVTEVNIKEYVFRELEALYKGDFLKQPPTITTDETGKTFQAVCICDKESIDICLGRLAHCGVGNMIGSVNVLPLGSSMFAKTVDANALKVETATHANETTSEPGNFGHLDRDDEERDDTKKFREAASQLKVEQVVEQITEAATISFDYVSLLVIASVLSGIGLAVNSTVTIVASMLVSPIMGPVLALTFGSVINNWKLMLLGISTELFSLLVCVFVGFLIGLVSIGWGTDGSWPTPEMKSRGLEYGLLVGLSIAIPSGMGVALSILGDNTSSLVGVAISASLLPPAVNCGLSFAYASFGFGSDNGAVDDDTGDFTTVNDYVHLGGVSLALTIINIGAIFLSGVVMFRLKGVIPAAHKVAFWQVEGEELNLYRKYNTARLGVNFEPLHPDDVDVLKSVGANKMLRKELLDMYKHCAIPLDGAGAEVSALTIKNIPERSAQPAGVLTDMFGELESQHESSRQNSPVHRRIKSRSNHLARDIEMNRYSPQSAKSVPQSRFAEVTSDEEKDMKARMKNFGTKK